MLSDCLRQGVRYAARTIFLFVFVASSLPARASGPAVALAWDASLDPTVAGYNVYYGVASRNYTNVISAGNTTSATVSNLVNGVTYYFAATTYTIDGLESDYSAEASYAAPPANNPPTLDPLADMAIDQDCGPQTVTLTGITSGSANESQTLTVSAFSSNPGLIPNPEVIYTSPDTNGSLSFAPAPGSFGSAIVTVMVDDGATISNTVIRSFTVTVIPVANPPTIDPLKNVTIAENAGLQTVNLTGISPGSTNVAATLNVAAVSSNPALIPNPGINYTSPATAGVLSFTPVTNAFGSSTITVTVTDDQPTNNSTSVSFTVTVNQGAPLAGLLTNAVIAPNTVFRYLVTPPFTNGDKFTLSLPAGAPVGSKIATLRNGESWFIWAPTLAQASTTNLIGLSFADLSNAALSTNEMLQVIVQDYIALTVGATNIQAGQNGSVPLILSSSQGVTNLTCAIAWPAGALPNPTLSVSAAGVASSSLRSQTNNIVVTLQMAPGQVLQGSNVIGAVNFQSLAAQSSGYLNLPVQSLTGIKASADSYLNAISTPGQVAVIHNLAMVQAAASSSSIRNLTVLGTVGNTYQVQYCTNFSPRAVWYNLTTYAQTNISQIIPVDPALSQVFYRVQQK